MRYQLNLSIEYHFDRPAGGGRQLLRVAPMALAGQQNLLHSQVVIHPDPLEHHVFTDFFGTEVHEIVMAPGLSDLRFELRAEVDRLLLGAPLDRSLPLSLLPQAMKTRRDLRADSPWHFIGPSPRIPVLPEIVEYAQRFNRDDPRAFHVIEALGLAIHRDMTFDAAATDAYTGVADAFALKRGVCQDYSQIMICALRALGVPAAYAAGYLRTLPPPGRPRLQGADAMHAWVRAWAGPEMGWLDYDPTNACWVDADHILVGFGRDYSDVAPVTGSLRLDGDHSGSHAVDIAETE